MKTNYNSMYFSKEDVAKGLHLKLIETLLNLSLESREEVVHIHTYTEDFGAVIVDWCQHNYEYDDNDTNTFVYIDSDECVMIERSFPDNHYEYFHNEEEYKEAFDTWLSEHKSYKQDDYGRWYDEEEQKALRQSLGLDKGDNDEGKN